MTFNLTGELNDEIISAMENQDTVFVVDARANRLIIQESEPDEDLFYVLPEWKPADGYLIRENFAKKVRVPLAHEELQDVLHSGRGVFKNYRNVLKRYPEIDKRWHIYKHKVMSVRINEWYNSLREIWGLEKLDQLSESEDTLVYDDFSFTEYDWKTDKKSILLNITAADCEDENLPSEINEFFFKMWKNQFENDSSETQTGFVCYSISEDFAGCITASQMLENQNKVWIINCLFVPGQYRGLGIGTELLSMCISKLQAAEKKWLLLPNLFGLEVIQPLLTRLGFEKISSGYILRLGD